MFGSRRLLPFATFAVRASRARIGESLHAAASVAGLGPGARFARITLPLVLPGAALGFQLVPGFVPGAGGDEGDDLFQDSGSQHAELRALVVGLDGEGRLERIARARSVGGTERRFAPVHGPLADAPVGMR